MDQINNELRCKKCGKSIKGDSYNAPDGPFCIDCWKIKLARNLKKSMKNNP